MKKLFATIFVCLFLFTGISHATVIDEAFSHLGCPYKYANHGPNKFDCSGFTYYCYFQAEGIKLSKSAKGQGYDDTYEKIESIKDLKVGDLVYFNTNTHDSDLSDHAGIYIGDGYFIHASSSKRKVIISSLLEGYYNERFSWGRRIVENVFNEVKE